MNIWGITATTHDASLSVIEDGEILFAAHSERYSKKKFDPELNFDIIIDAMQYGKPDVVCFYENTWKKKWRQIRCGNFSYAFNQQKFPRNYLKQFGINAPIKYTDHHLSHAAAGYYTSSFDDCVAVVIDSVGELQTMSIWDIKNGQFSLKHEMNFPHSIGLLYSAFTKRCGLKPNSEEYILMGMAAYGCPIHVNDIANDFLCDWMPNKDVHCGIGNWKPEAKKEDLAASIQVVCQKQIEQVMNLARKYSKNLVYMGGVALNCLANSTIEDFDNIWIMPNPGDAGSSLGAAAYHYGQKLNWKGPYLGTDIPGDYICEEACDRLLKGEIIGVANGRAEFGPRAFGNRSLLADPRSHDMKDQVNMIKRRQKFRPFAPSVLAEHAENWFEIKHPSRYMQFVSKCKRSDDVPAICHVDGTSRVQTVSRNDNAKYHELLSLFFEKTGCPMLLNTSLNIRGMPLVNDERDARMFSERYNVVVF